ncbi:hypothetical protein A2U01_0105009 [Trifolium medium]|uniref:Uncharacterized protein n=1 Tax=Trifolium medium TaxID=97028 RepID=A0A392V8G7_9FABA|nr:hypothetical protein [Trifolium medium]
MGWWNLSYLPRVVVMKMKMSFMSFVTAFMQIRD